MTTSSLAEVVGAWTAFYEARPHAAHARLREFRAHGAPKDCIGEQLGAALALTPREHRCAHWGDDRYCSQCLLEEGT